MILNLVWETPTLQHEMLPRGSYVCICGHQWVEGRGSWIFGTMAQLAEVGCILKVIATSRSGCTSVYFIYWNSNKSYHTILSSQTKLFILSSQWWIVSSETIG